MFEFLFSEHFLASVVLFATPILFASMAALISNKVGLLNINIEGSMSMAALVGGLVSFATQSWVAGLFSAILTGVVFSLLLTLFTLKFGTNSVLTGIALNMLASGLSIYLLYVIVGVKGDSSIQPSVMIPSLNLPILSDIPILGKVLFSQNLLVYLVILSAILVSFLLKKTKLGLHITATGYHPLASTSVGINTAKMKVFALILCGVFAGLGGAYLSMVYLSYFSSGMVAGRGFIGLAAEAMGHGAVLPTFLFALFFGAVEYFAVGAQTVLGFPYELLNTLPYVVTVIALVLYAIKKKYGTKRSKD